MVILMSNLICSSNLEFDVSIKYKLNIESLMVWYVWIKEMEGEERKSVEKKLA